MTNHTTFPFEKPIVCIQGLGFVGMAMSIAVANARDNHKNPYYNVIGVDLPNDIGKEKINAVNNGELPLITNDIDLQNAFELAISQNNLKATSDPEVYSQADIIVVDIHLDVLKKDDDNYTASFDGFRKALQTIGQYVKPGTLILVETTVPPGTCEKVVVPELNKAMIERGYEENSLLIAHSYERVMPGKNYYKSIVKFWRVYSGVSDKAADAAEHFLSRVIDSENYPLTRLHSTTASETAKVLENSYRAANIAFIQEWGAFAEEVGVDLFEVLDAIRIRPTHNNIRFPGFGVGGYCLTKDPHFVGIGARELFGLNDLSFPFNKSAVSANEQMPLTVLKKVKKVFNGDIAGKTILLLGVSYLQDVGDTRYSPSETFVVEAEKLGAKVIPHDPLIDHWDELDRTVHNEIPALDNIDIVVFAVQHSEYKNIDIQKWAKDINVILLDAHNVLTKEQTTSAKTHNIQLQFIGKGEK